ncbi:MDR/zinc-dependent alcohol dehydrogenase-like family protein [Candidatus Marithrix sp. Canyon 246]|uniref:MDR/zinc-dependent alcohol dehydrogenase-like family protein n=1 Tax=Candidatus Marithrix sp. Canyon 246 TaxID=1827136 RepID=UPI000849F947|nr:alcohol dehydrogenase catalytic domain-containing protein [Candidatus Marithrix sp. Canyon 246]
MQAICLQDKSLKFIDNFPQIQPQYDEALVRVHLAGICGTDLELVKGYYPYNGILGHEFVGEIIKAPTAPERIGERVVGEINISCGICDSCVTGLTTHCQRRSVLGILNRHGAFAEYLCLPLKNLIPVADTISDEAAVFTEPLAAALAIQQQVHILATDKVLVIGAGRLGQLIAQTLALTGCDLQVVARYDKQRRLLATRNIISIKETQIQTDYDIVIEATGSTEGLTLASQIVRPRGTIVLKSTYKGKTLLDFSKIVVNEIKLVGSRCGSFKPALQLLEKKLVDPTILIEFSYHLNQALEAFDFARQSGKFKVLFKII